MFDTGFFVEYLYALNALSDTQNWRFQFVSTVHISTVITGQMIYFGSDDHNVYALNSAGGTVAWQFAAGDTVDSSPAIAAF